MTELISKEISDLQIECQHLRDDTIILRNGLKSGYIWLSEEFLSGNDKKVKFYTGIPTFDLLKVLFTFVSVSVPSQANSTLSNFQQFVVVLAKLRLNLTNQDIGYRFDLHQTTISKMFKKWINIMYIRLKPLIKWPEREKLLKTMPAEFKKKFKKCVIVVDCFEIFCERPTSLEPRAQTWSNYKQHNSVKFLIGIAPQGVISFISNAWGGRVSDVYITENCGVLDNLMPGDLLLADRGFTIQDSVGLLCAEVKTPTFTRGKNQLSKFEVESSRQLSRVRIHVERVIGVIRQKYTMLQSTLPINVIMCNGKEERSIIDKILTVCCALCNCCDSVVNFN